MSFVHIDPEPGLVTVGIGSPGNLAGGYPLRANVSGSVPYIGAGQALPAATYGIPQGGTGGLTVNGDATNVIIRCTEAGNVQHLETIPGTGMIVGQAGSTTSSVMAPLPSTPGYQNQFSNSSLAMSATSIATAYYPLGSILDAEIAPAPNRTYYEWISPWVAGPPVTGALQDTTPPPNPARQSVPLLVVIVAPPQFVYSQGGLPPTITILNLPVYAATTIESQGSARQRLVVRFYPTWKQLGSVITATSALSRNKVRFMLTAMGGSSQNLAAS